MVRQPKATQYTDPHLLFTRFPDERLTRTQALKGMTFDAAYASFAEDDIGSLVPGKKADFVVLDRDIMNVPIGKVLETKVLATVVDGRVEYGEL
jgi:predicted amidohydrolase YtcJ